MALPDQSETPTLERVILRAIDIAVSELRVSLPGVVLKYYPEEHRADVQPALKTKYVDSDGVATVRLLPVVVNVPVGHPRANGAVVHMPLAPEDVVHLVFADRSLDKWLGEGGTVDPEDVRKHHLTDAWCYPGGYPFNDPIVIPDPTALTLLYGSSEIRVKKDGVITVKGGTETHLGGLAPTKHVALAELVASNLSAFKAAFDGHTHPETGVATGPPAAPFPAVSTVASSVVKAAD